MRAAAKRIRCGWLGKDSEAAVALFASGSPVALAGELDPPPAGPIEVQPASAWALYRQVRALLGRFRIGAAPLLPTGAALASWLFPRGVSLDRILPRSNRRTPSGETREFEGRPLSSARRRIAILAPFAPWPLSHGGAVRIFSLLREMAGDFDVFLLAFDEGGEGPPGPLTDLCARVTLVSKPRRRKPRWSTLLPPEAHEYESPAMRAALARARAADAVELVQVESTQLARYGGDVLVEHAVMFDLHAQIQRRQWTLSTWWNLWRWRRFERFWTRRYRRVAVMSAEDKALLGGGSNIRVVPNGVDLERFVPRVELPGQKLLFAGSFRHFPNVAAFRFFLEDVWPRVRERFPRAAWTVAAGPRPALHWREHTGLAALPSAPGLDIPEFVSDVRPLYEGANLVVVPAPVSAGTNLNVLEAMAMERAVISTSSGTAGLGLAHGESVWVADGAEAFAAGVTLLLGDADLRRRIAQAGREAACLRFGWRRIGALQRALLDETLGVDFVLRGVRPADLPAIASIQSSAPEASQWTPEDYLAYDTRIALIGGEIAGFLVSRTVGEGEREILNVAVNPRFRRRGVATALIRAEMELRPACHFLEVRESNLAARRLYEGLGFKTSGLRPAYYEDPPEAAIVMRILS